MPFSWGQRAGHGGGHRAELCRRHAGPCHTQPATRRMHAGERQCFLQRGAGRVASGRPACHGGDASGP